MADSTGDASGQHAEGIQHIASNAVPEGTTDASRGTEGGLGTGTQSSGVGSSSEKFESPLYPGGSSTGTSGTGNGIGSGIGSGTGTGSNLEQTSSQGGVIDTVKSYLGYGATGNNASETGQLGTTEGTRNAQDTSYGSGSGLTGGSHDTTHSSGTGTGLTGTGTHDSTSTSGSGSGAGISGMAASAASAVGLGSGNSAAGGGLGSTSSTSGAGSSSTTGSSLTGSSSTTGGSGSTLATAKEKIQDVTNTNTSGDDKPVTSGEDSHKPPQAAGGKPHKLENESSIPTAGGERLGEKHWGESKIVPDNPDTRASQGGVSSEAGQPTQQTTDNTAKNTGGATGPPASSNHGSTDARGAGEEKPKTMDKIKDKLHIGKKEE